MVSPGGAPGSSLLPDGFDASDWLYDPSGQIASNGFSSQAEFFESCFTCTDGLLRAKDDIQWPPQLTFKFPVYAYGCRADSVDEIMSAGHRGIAISNLNDRNRNKGRHLYAFLPGRYTHARSRPFPNWIRTPASAMDVTLDRHRATVEVRRAQVSASPHVGLGDPTFVEARIVTRGCPPLVECVLSRVSPSLLPSPRGVCHPHLPPVTPLVQPWCAYSVRRPPPSIPAPHCRES